MQRKSSTLPPESPRKRLKRGKKMLVFPQTSNFRAGHFSLLKTWYSAGGGREVFLKIAALTARFPNRGPQKHPWHTWAGAAPRGKEQERGGEQVCEPEGEGGGRPAQRCLSPGAGCWPTALGAQEPRAALPALPGAGPRRGPTSESTL